MYGLQKKVFEQKSISKKEKNFENFSFTVHNFEWGEKNEKHPHILFLGLEKTSILVFLNWILTAPVKSYVWINVDKKFSGEIPLFETE